LFCSLFSADSGWSGILPTGFQVNAFKFGCPGCHALEGASQAKITTIMDDTNYKLTILLYFQNTSHDPPRVGLGNHVIIIHMSNTTMEETWKVYTNNNENVDTVGKAEFDFSKYKDSQLNFRILYCPFTCENDSVCGFQECLNYSGIKPKPAANTIDDIPDAVPLKFPKPAKINCSRLLPTVANAGYSPPPKGTPLTPSFCWPVLLLFALLGGALYMTGRNPFLGFDFSAPRLGRHIKYTARGRGFSVDVKSVAMSVKGFADGVTGKRQDKPQVFLVSQVGDAVGAIKGGEGGTRGLVHMVGGEARIGAASVAARPGAKKVFENAGNVFSSSINRLRDPKTGSLLGGGFSGLMSRYAEEFGRTARFAASHIGASLWDSSFLGYMMKWSSSRDGSWLSAIFGQGSFAEMVNNWWAKEPAVARSDAVTAMQRVVKHYGSVASTTVVAERNRDGSISVSYKDPETGRKIDAEVLRMDANSAEQHGKFTGAIKIKGQIVEFNSGVVSAVTANGVTYSVKNGVLTPEALSSMPETVKIGGKSYKVSQTGEGSYNITDAKGNSVFTAAIRQNEVAVEVVLKKEEIEAAKIDVNKARQEISNVVQDNSYQIKTVTGGFEIRTAVPKTISGFQLPSLAFTVTTDTNGKVTAVTDAGGNKVTGEDFKAIKAIGSTKPSEVLSVYTQMPELIKGLNEKVTTERRVYMEELGRAVTIQNNDVFGLHNIKDESGSITERKGNYTMIIPGTGPDGKANDLYGQRIVVKDDVIVQATDVKRDGKGNVVVDKYDQPVRIDIQTSTRVDDGRTVFKFGDKQFELKSEGSGTFVRTYLEDGQEYVKTANKAIDNFRTVIMEEAGKKAEGSALDKALGEYKDTLRKAISDSGMSDTARDLYASGMIDGRQKILGEAQQRAGEDLRASGKIHGEEADVEYAKAFKARVEVATREHLTANANSSMSEQSHTMLSSYGATAISAEFRRAGGEAESGYESALKPAKGLLGIGVSLATMSDDQVKGALLLQAKANGLSEQQARSYTESAMDMLPQAREIAKKYGAAVEEGVRYSATYLAAGSTADNALYRVPDHDDKIGAELREKARLSAIAEVKIQDAQTAASVNTILYGLSEAFKGKKESPSDEFLRLVVERQSGNTASDEVISNAITTYRAYERAETNQRNEFMSYVRSGVSPESDNVKDIGKLALDYGQQAAKTAVDPEARVPTNYAGFGNNQAYLGAYASMYSGLTAGLNVLAGTEHSPLEACGRTPTHVTVNLAKPEGQDQNTPGRGSMVVNEGLTSVVAGAAMADEEDSYYYTHGMKSIGYINAAADSPNKAPENLSKATNEARRAVEDIAGGSTYSPPISDSQEKLEERKRMEKSADAAGFAVEAGEVRSDEELLNQAKRLERLARGQADKTQAWLKQDDEKGREETARKQREQDIDAMQALDKLDKEEQTREEREEPRKRGRKKG
jgi:hypothetical protein